MLNIALKKLSAIIIIFYILFAHSHAQTSNKEKDIADKSNVFGMRLGFTSEDEIKNIAAYFKPVGYVAVTKNGKTIYLDQDDSLSQIISSANFEISDNHFNGKFINGILFELTVKSSEYEDEFEDVELISGIRNKFNKNHKKLKSTVESGNELGFKNWSNKNDFWAINNAGLIVSIIEYKKYIISEYACLKYMLTFSETTIGAIRLKYDCYKATDGIPRYTILYKDSTLNSEAFSIAQMAEDQKNQKETDKKSNKIKSF